MSEPRIELREAQPYLSVRERITAGVSEFADRVFPELFGWLSRHGVQPAGPPFIRYVEIDAQGEAVELEVGVPVANDAVGSASGAERVRAEELPAGRYLTYVHVGPYRSTATADLADARRLLLSWAEERGLSLGWGLEQFRIGPVDDSDFTKWETELAYLLT